MRRVAAAAAAAAAMCSHNVCNCGRVKKVSYILLRIAFKVLQQQQQRKIYIYLYNKVSELNLIKLSYEFFARYDSIQLY